MNNFRRFPEFLKPKFYSRILNTKYLMIIWNLSHSLYTTQYWFQGSGNRHYIWIKIKLKNNHIKCKPIKSEQKSERSKKHLSPKKAPIWLKSTWKDAQPLVIWPKLQIRYHFTLVSGASLVAQTVKNPPAVRETWVWSLDWDNPLEKATATHSSILAWRIPWTEESSGLQSMGLQRVGHDWETHFHTGQNGHHQKSIMQTINAGEVVEKREPSYTDGGNVNWYTHYEEQYGDSLIHMETENPYRKILQSHSWTCIRRKP